MFNQGLDITHGLDFLTKYYLEKAQKDQQDEALKKIGEYFQTQQANYSQPDTGRPTLPINGATSDLMYRGTGIGKSGTPLSPADINNLPFRPMQGVTQPITPSSVNFQTVPATPSLNDWGFLSSLMNYGQLGGNANAIANIITPKVTPINQEGGGLDIVTSWPTGKTEVKRAIPPDFSRMGLGQPTELAKYQNELNMIQKANPNDPRIPQYQDMIKKLTQGLPYFTLAQTSEGFVPVNARTGQPQANTGLTKPLTGEMITAEQQIGGLKESLQRVKTLYKPDYVGAVAGRLGEVKQATVGVPEDQAQFYSAIADIGNTLIYLKSGKQINEKEYDRLKKQIPSPTDPVSTFNGKMTEFERELNSVIANRRAAQGGYGVPKTKVIDDPLGILK